MATGYTECVRTGDVTDFPTFAMRCARAFGALIEMRDDPLDAEIPTTFEPAGYYEASLLADRQRLAEIVAMTDEQCESAAKREYETKLESHRKTVADCLATRTRYQHMLSEVASWVPPTDDHRGLKDFMVQQLTQSVEWDCNEPESPPTAVTGDVWRAANIEHLTKWIELRAESAREERERCDKRTEWVKSLRESLK